MDQEKIVSIASTRLFAPGSDGDLLAMDDSNKKSKIGRLEAFGKSNDLLNHAYLSPMASIIHQTPSRMTSTEREILPSTFLLH